MHQLPIKGIIAATLVMNFLFLATAPQAFAKIYIDEEYKFWIEYPDNWWFDESGLEINPMPGINDGTIIFPSFRDGIAYWYQFTSVTLIKNSTVAMNYQGDKFFDVITEDLRNSCKIASFEYEGHVCSDYQVLEKKTLQINGMKAYQITDSWTESYPDGISITKNSIVTDFVVGNDLWQIDSIVVKSKAELDEVKQIPYSFKFLDDSKYFTGKNIQNIPEWIKNNAGWWATGQIDDGSFVQGIQWMIKEDIMKIPKTQQGTGSGASEIPEWIKNNAGWWATGQIDDGSFVQGIQWMIKEGIIKLS